MSYGAHVRRLAGPLFRHAIGRRAALRFAARRGRSLVLLYHRVLPDHVVPGAIVPSVPRHLFRRHVDVLQRLGDVVPLAHLLQPHTGPRPRFALTFDDDHAGYVETVVPDLQARGVTAAFFLSGRALHGLPSYWWAAVEQSLRTCGLDETRRRLGVPARTAAELAIALERLPHAVQLASLLPHADEPPLTSGDIRSIARAGMTIGFHTLHHPVLSALDQAELRRALIDGRDELAAAAGATIDLLAYPHGRATAVVADAAERAAYRAAFTAGGRPITRASDPFMLDRWEPGALDPDELAAQLAMRMMRPPTSPRPRERSDASVVGGAGRDNRAGSTRDQ